MSNINWVGTVLMLLVMVGYFIGMDTRGVMYLSVLYIGILLEQIRRKL